jgi:hypothetical protein
LELVLVVLVFGALDVLRIRHALPHPNFGDEWRYIYYADNLLHGFFSPRERVFLCNGPGYPLLILPFVGAGWNDGARYVNAFWHAGTMGYAWAILRPYLRVRWIVLAVAALGFYQPLVRHLPLIYTEVVCCFLITGWLYHALRAERSVTHTLVAGAYLGVLALTKVIFGASLLVFTAALLGLWLYRRSSLWSAYLKLSLLALTLCVPYLSYTYQLTGRWLHWSSGQGSNFYWLTAPARDEFGDWYHNGWVRNNPMLHAHHGRIFAQVTGTLENPNLSEMEQIFNMSTPESADIFVKAGLENIRKRPIKFARNYVANLSRLLFDVPTSVRGTPFWNPATLWNLPLLLVTCWWLAYASYRRLALPRAFWPVVGLALITLGGYSLASSEARFLIPIVPLWWLTGWAWFGVAFRPNRSERRSVVASDGAPIERVTARSSVSRRELGNFGTVRRFAAQFTHSACPLRLGWVPSCCDTTGTTRRQRGARRRARTAVARCSRPRPALGTAKSR